MNELYLMLTISDRSRLKHFLNFYESCGITVGLVNLAYGTAKSEILGTLGLEKTEKVILSSVVTGKSWKAVNSGLRDKMAIDVPGGGIAFIIPMSSIGGKPQLMFLCGEQELSVGEESSLKNVDYELLIVISNIGYSDQVMEAARKANARGGTVLHAKGTGMRGSEKFLGVSLASEKEMIYIVVRHEEKNDVMRSIMDTVGLNSKAQSIVFSLPVTATAGIKFSPKVTEDEDENP